MNFRINITNITVSIGLLLAADMAFAEERLNSISTRAKVLTGNDAMIAGFIISGDSTKCVVVRARGPSLNLPEGTERLADPTLRLVRQSDKAIMGENDDWKNQTGMDYVVLLTDSGLAPSNDSEAALYKCLEPGAYTAIVRGVSQGTGAGIVEVIDVSVVAPTAEYASACEWVYNFSAGVENEVSCPAAKYALSGGCSVISDNPDTVLVRSFPTGLLGGNGDWKNATGWSCKASSDDLLALDANALCCASVGSSD